MDEGSGQTVNPESITPIPSVPPPMPAPPVPPPVGPPLPTPGTWLDLIYRSIMKWVFPDQPTAPPTPQERAAMLDLAQRIQAGQIQINAAPTGATTTP